MKYQIQPTQVPDDLNSCWFHPDIELHDTIGEHAEFYTKEQWAQLQKNLGVSIKSKTLTIGILKRFQKIILVIGPTGSRSHHKKAYF